MRSQRSLTSGRERFRAKIRGVVGPFHCSRHYGSARRRRKPFRTPPKIETALTFSDSKRQKIRPKSSSTEGVHSSSALIPRRSESALRLLSRKMRTMLGRPRCPVQQRPVHFAIHRNRDNYIKRCGHEGKLKAQMTTVVYQEEYGKEYRLPTQWRSMPRRYQKKHGKQLQVKFRTECPMNRYQAFGPETLGFQCPIYGFKKWSDLFTSRQLLALMTFVKWTRAARRRMKKVGYSAKWDEAVEAYLAINVDRLASYNST